MDMSVTEGARLAATESERGLTAITTIRDGLGRGLARHRGRPVIAGALAAWCPMISASFFVVDIRCSRPCGPIVGPLWRHLVRVSVGNIPWLRVWNGGISFGGVIAFIFAIWSFFRS